MAHMTLTARTVVHMARWLADFADPSFLTASKHSRRSITAAKRREKEIKEVQKKTFQKSKSLKT